METLAMPITPTPAPVTTPVLTSAEVAKTYGPDIEALAPGATFDTSANDLLNVVLPNRAGLSVPRALFADTIGGADGVKLNFTSENGFPTGLLPEPKQAAALLGQLPDVASADYTPAGNGGRAQWVRTEQIDVTAKDDAAVGRLQALLADKYGTASVYVFPPLKSVTQPA
jgi:hypothetical protein